MHNEHVLRQSVQQIEGLLHSLETIADPHVRTSMQQLVQALLAWHGAGLARIMALVAQAGEPGTALMDRFVHDEVVASVLLLYALHPTDLETRVRQALETVRPAVRAHGGQLELVSITEGVVRLRLQGGRHGGASSAMAFKLALETALAETAPDIAGLEVEGVAAHASPSGFVPLAQFRGLGPPAR